MKIQVLKFLAYDDYSSWYQSAVKVDQGEYVSYSFGDMALNSLNSPAEFDAFDINVICVDEEEFWKNSGGDSRSKVNSNPDLDSIAQLSSRTKSIVVLALPNDNIYFSYLDPRSYGNDFKTIPIKDILTNACAIALRAIGSPNINGSIVYGSGITTVGQQKMRSSFFLDGSWDEVITTTEQPSLKPTTVKDCGFIVTTLPILQSEMAFSEFIEIVFDKKPIADAPEWFYELPPMLDDAMHLEEIKHQETIIENASKKVAESRSRLEENAKWKSILYTNGTQLENTVRELLGELFGWNPQSFKDCGTSDFIFEHQGIYYAGEIKGENSNVVNSHLSQLELNYDLDVEAGLIPEGSMCRKLLIANTFRKKPPINRPQVDEKQIDLARDNYGCLIVTTPVLLALYGAFRASEVSLQCVIDLLSKTGILSESDFMNNTKAS